MLIRWWELEIPVSGTKLWKEELWPWVRKVTKLTLRGKWEGVFSWRHVDNVPKETHAVSTMTQPQETVAGVTDEKDNRLLLHQVRRPRLTAREKNPRKIQETEMKDLQTERAKFRADTEIVITRHVASGILPYVKTASLRLDAHLATSAILDMLRQMRPPAKCQRNVAQKDQLLYWRSLFNWVVCLNTLMRE